MTIVMSLQVVGNILVLALLVTPAATARLLTARIGPMMAAAGLIGLGASTAGLYLSYYLDLAASGVIVVVLTGLFVLAWLFAPRWGLVSAGLSRWLAHRPVTGRDSVARS